MGDEDLDVGWEAVFCGVLVCRAPKYRAKVPRRALSRDNGVGMRTEQKRAMTYEVLD